MTAIRLPRRRLLVALVALAACDGPPPASAPIVVAPITTPADTAALPNQYIVVLKPGAADPAVLASRTLAQFGGTLHYTYRTALRGFAATLSPTAIQSVRADPNVAYIERDALMHATGSESHPPSWGLDRIDQRGLPDDATYSFSNNGSGVTAYIIDTGIRTTHQEFGGRASWGVDYSNANGTDVDCAGHGTHVAGTVGGATVGVAEGVSLVAVRVLDCSGSGSTSGVIAGVDWVTAHAVHPAVANMSLGGSPSAALDAAVEASIASGVTYVVAAGNDDADACYGSPARAPDALTVGATDSTDTRAYFSDWGPCVDLFAPGYWIFSAYIYQNFNNYYAYLSGTSMATPHVAGVAALWLAAHPTDTPAEVADSIVRDASANRLIDVPNGTANLLLYSGLTAETGGRIALSTPLLEFEKIVGAPDFAPRLPAGTSPPGPADPQSVTLANIGSASVNWTAATNQPWASVTPTSGTLAAGDSVPLTVSVKPGTLPAGTYDALVRVSAAGTLNGPVYTTARLFVLSGNTLTSGTPVTGIWGDERDNLRFYRIVVEPGTARLDVATSGGTGDVDLNVKYGSPPNAPDDGDCLSATDGNTESCVITNPAPGNWWIMLQKYISYSGVTLTATLTPGAPPADPSDITATLASSTEIDVTWTDNSTDEDHFNIGWRAKLPGGAYGPWTTITPSLPANTTSFAATGLAGNRVYQYRVRACNYGGCTDWNWSNTARTP